MVGQGPFDLGPGQITDDSELAMCILQGLTDPGLRCKESKHAGSSILNLDGIAYYFGKWLQGDIKPFDIGATTRQAFKSIKFCYDKQEFLTNEVYDTVIVSTYKNSTSNGSLMRMTTLAAFCYKLNKEDMKKAIFL